MGVVAMEGLGESVLKVVDGAREEDYKRYTLVLFHTMSKEQFLALHDKVNDDAGLREKLKAAADLDAALAIAKDAGFDVSKADWLKHQAKQTIELSDEELEGVAGGTVWFPTFGWPC